MERVSNTMRYTRLWAMNMLCACLALLVLCSGAFAEEPGEQTLVERLGFPRDAKLLIINGDDFGMNHSTNVGTIAALKSGVLTSATVMVPCPWFPMAADFSSKQPKANVGVHLVGTTLWHYKLKGLGRKSQKTAVQLQGGTRTKTSVL